MKPYRIIISGGGTGGHIYPALAIADEMKRRHPDTEFLFVGARDRMEMEKVPQAGYTIEGLWISGIQRRLTWSNLMFPFKLLSSMVKSARILRRFKPDAAVGTGGFASGPMLKTAVRKNIPTLIQEQNSFAGITNKLLAKEVDTICVAYDHMDRYFPKDKIIKTGNPVRQDLLDVSTKREFAIKKYNLDPERQTILVLGGSLGARTINKLIAKKYKFLLKQGVQILWQTGKLYIDQYEHFNQKEGIKVMAYIDTMDLAYAAADLIISRAGAGSVSELCVVGKPVIFIPSPNVAEDHQTKNAEAIAAKGGAILIAEHQLDTLFELEARALIKNQEKQQALAAAIKELALPRATKDIVDELEKLLASSKTTDR
ncbi:undecaprenyldiphospho-muramoylpentapeptide beta-N-acetylglucosaminyltransferase [Croceiramulus getboli]|nr:undecaprenyldiphospho-muramoylpentapeptide beta-N-acetylglucosaminyltransferase [Flavobacteriaceae bacterium YJPT1-3]